MPCFEESPDRGRALSALRVACLDDVVEGLPRGLDTVVSEEVEFNYVIAPNKPNLDFEPGDMQVGNSTLR